jgi:hypothetical protein
LTDLLNPKLYNGDGRILISLIPLLLFSLRSATYGDLQRVRNILVWMGGASFVAFVIWLATKTSILSGAGHTDEFHGFLTSHTGAGTFFGALSVFLMLYGYESRNKYLLLLGLLLVGPVIGSASRESLLGMFITIVWYLVIRNPKPKMVVSVFILIFLSAAILPLVSQKTYNHISALFSEQFIQSTFEQAEMGLESDWAVGDWTTGGGDVQKLEEGDVTSLVRILLWTYSARKLIASPFIGLGWGRFNDTNLVLVGVPGLFEVAVDGEQRLSTSNAHSTYFHVLAESGTVGLFMLLSIWVLLYGRLGKASRLLCDFIEIRAYLVASQGLVVYALGCALTGHALASPSLMVPVFTILGTGIAFIRTNIKRTAEGSQDRLQDVSSSHS